MNQGPSPRVSLALDFLLDAGAPLTDFELACAMAPTNGLKVDTEFLVHQSPGMVQSFMLNVYAAAANARGELEEFLANPRLARDVRRARKGKFGSPSARRFGLLDCLVDRLCTVRLAQWVLNGGLEEIRQTILDGPPGHQAFETLMADVNKQLRNFHRSPEEIAALADWRRRVKENPGAAHRAAVVRYAQRHIDNGKCERCPRPLDRDSVRYCKKHLEGWRERKRRKAAALNKPAWGKSPATLAGLRAAREELTQIILREKGIPRKRAAIGIKEATAALLAVMPDSEERALDMAQLFTVAVIPTKATGQQALRKLFLAGAVQRVGKGAIGNHYRFFITNGGTNHASSDLRESEHGKQRPGPDNADARASRVLRAPRLAGVRGIR
jgi:hypothetical protein